VRCDKGVGTERHFKGILGPTGAGTANLPDAATTESVRTLCVMESDSRSSKVTGKGFSPTLIFGRRCSLEWAIRQAVDSRKWIALDVASHRQG
jgi:hypothetical protein